MNQGKVEEYQKSASEKTGRRLWVWVLLAFLILISAWAALIVIATRNQPEIIEIDSP